VEFWKANDEVHDMVMRLVASNHPDLVLISDEIVVVFREKAAHRGGQVVLGKAYRAPTLANVLSGEAYKFVLEIPADVWESGLTSRKKEALLDHLLCSCTCEEDTNSGNVKCWNLSPDIVAYRENIERYGMWFPRDEDDKEISSDDVLQDGGGDVVQEEDDNANSDS